MEEDPPVRSGGFKGEGSSAVRSAGAGPRSCERRTRSWPWACPPEARSRSPEAELEAGSGGAPGSEVCRRRTGTEGEARGGECLEKLCVGSRKEL